jgi:hypothetical protein
MEIERSSFVSFALFGRCRDVRRGKGRVEKREGTAYLTHDALESIGGSTPDRPHPGVVPKAADGGVGESTTDEATDCW